MRYAMGVVFGCGSGAASDAPEAPAKDSPGGSGNEESDDSGAASSDSGDPADDGVCDPVTVALTGTPTAATVVLEPALCECAVLAVSQGLPGLVLTWNAGVGYGQGDAVGGWTCASVEGEPTAEIFPDGLVIAGLAYDRPYAFRMVHPETGVEARIRARLTRGAEVELIEQSWVGCP